MHDNELAHDATPAQTLTPTTPWSWSLLTTLRRSTCHKHPGTLTSLSPPSPRKHNATSHTKQAKERFSINTITAASLTSKPRGVHARLEELLHPQIPKQNIIKKALLAWKQTIWPALSGNVHKIPEVSEAQSRAIITPKRERWATGGCSSRWTDSREGPPQRSRNAISPRVDECGTGGRGGQGGYWRSDLVNERQWLQSFDEEAWKCVYTQRERERGRQTD